MPQSRVSWLLSDIPTLIWRQKPLDSSSDCAQSAVPLLRPQLSGREVGGIQLPFVFKINIFIHHLNAHIINSYAPAAVLSLISSSPPCNWLTLLHDLLGENVWDLHFPRKRSNHSLLLKNPSFCLGVLTEGSPICGSAEMKGCGFSFMLP